MTSQPSQAQTGWSSATPNSDLAVGLLQAGRKQLQEPTVRAASGGSLSPPFEMAFLAPASRPSVHIRRGRLLHFVGRQIRATGRAASDDAGWVVLVEDLQ